MAVVGGCDASAAAGSASSWAVGPQQRVFIEPSSRACGTEKHYHIHGNCDVSMQTGAYGRSFRSLPGTAQSSGFLVPAGKLGLDGRWKRHSSADGDVGHACNLALARSKNATALAR